MIVRRADKLSASFVALREKRVPGGKVSALP